MAIFNNFKKQKTALCLGGGGARGFAHVGAIKAFEEAGIKFDLVAGTSVGSLLGALYASGVTSEQMIKMGDELETKNLRSGFTPNDPLKIGAIVRKVVGDKRFEDCQIPLYIVAVDLVSARQIIIDKGPLYEAVSASCAVPIFFKPLIKGRMHLVDGGLLNNIPADVCRMMGADKIITVDINHARGSGTESLGFMDVAKATFSIMSSASSREGLINSDIIIAPDLTKYSATKKDGHDEMIELGYLATKEKIPQIKELLGIKEKLTKEQVKELKLAQKEQKRESKLLAKQQKLQKKLERMASKSNGQTDSAVEVDLNQSSPDYADDDVAITINEIPNTSTTQSSLATSTASATPATKPKKEKIKKEKIK